MTSVMSHPFIEVSCPACWKKYAVPLEIIEESQHPLDRNARRSEIDTDSDFSRWEDDGGAF